jgi:hypothetical protein
MSSIIIEEYLQSYGDSLLNYTPIHRHRTHFDLRIERSTRRPQFYSLRPSLCGQPAVDDEPGAGHEGGTVGGEMQRSGEAPVMVARAEGRRSAGESPLIP